MTEESAHQVDITILGVSRVALSRAHLRVSSLVTFNVQFSIPLQHIYSIAVSRDSIIWQNYSLCPSWGFSGDSLRLYQVERIVK